MELKLYSIKEVAEKLNVSRQRIDQLIQANRINPIWIGGTRVISSEELKRFQSNK